MDYTKKLEEEYGQDKMAQTLISEWRADGYSDEKIYNLLESFF